MPSNSMREAIYQKLLKDGILIENEAPTINYKSYENYERITERAIAIACLYSENHKIPLILGDLPEITFRRNLIAAFTLMQL
jgi:hypothetical protein